MGLVVYGPAITLKTVTQFPLWASMIIVAAGGIFYTSIGGFKAVIWADVFQSIIIVIGIFAILIQGLIKVGGSNEVWRINEEYGRIQFDEFSPDITVRHTVWGMVIANMIQFFSLATAKWSYSESCPHRPRGRQCRPRSWLFPLCPIWFHFLFPRSDGLRIQRPTGM